MWTQRIDKHHAQSKIIRIISGVVEMLLLGRAFDSRVNIEWALYVDEYETNM